MSAGKFVIGVVLLGLLGFMLDINSFLYTQDKDDRTFLSSHRILLLEKDLNKRLSNISFLKGISGRKLEYLDAVEVQTLAEIDQADKHREELKRKKEREDAEKEGASRAEVQRAKKAERLAKEAAEEAKRQTDIALLEASKAHDMALQEAYPNVDLFTLKRQGYRIP